MIGHLQRNKVKYIVGQVAADPFRGYLPPGRGDQHSGKEEQNVIVPILVEVNIAHEESKFGISAGRCDPT